MVLEDSTIAFKIGILVEKEKKNRIIHSQKRKGKKIVFFFLFKCRLYPFLRVILVQRVYPCLGIFLEYYIGPFFKQFWVFVIVFEILEKQTHVKGYFCTKCDILHVCLRISFEKATHQSGTSSYVCSEIERKKKKRFIGR